MPCLADGFETVGVFNPGAVDAGGKVHLLLRVAEAPKQTRRGYVALPKSNLKGGLEIDWVRDTEVYQDDVRSAVSKRSGRVRLTSVSRLYLATSADGVSIDHIEEAPVFEPREEYEEFGVEDPRITEIDGTYYVTYVAVSSHGIATALATTDDFHHFRRYGIIFPTENKDVVLFPEKIDGHYVALHRPSGHTPMGRPEIWLAHSPDLVHWGRHRLVLRAQDVPGAARMGAGAPPLRIEEGWLEVFHVARPGQDEDAIPAYCGAAMVLGERDPSRVLRGSTAPFLAPEEAFETAGFVPGVVFPTGVVLRNGRLLIYYGAADTVTAVAETSLEALAAEFGNGPLTAAGAGAD